MTEQGRVLLLGADYYGTLAAARCFGKRGLDVVMADDNKNGRALYSRYVREKLIHPPLSRPKELVDWLDDWGKKNPGTLLYPPNDHLSWLFAAERERLSKSFLMFSPSESAIITLLDKQRMHEACASVGIDFPETHEVSQPTTKWPVLLKPLTQVFL